MTREGRGRPLRTLLVPLLFLVAILPAAAMSGNVENEEGVRAIVHQEVVPGLLQKSPDLFLRSYHPDARVFSFGHGEVGVEEYRRILSEFFDTVTITEVDPQILDLKEEGTRARMAVSYVERGKRHDGSPYANGYKRYYLLERDEGKWKVLVDGYNESMKEIKGFHH